ncbi:MAG: DUF928 domain-containing protein, partial [Cyanobacteria bacterium J06628_4]
PSVPRGGGTQAVYRTPPAPDDAPETGGAGAGRVYCPALAADVVFSPVVPSPPGWGLTTQSTPTVWVHLAYEGPQPIRLPAAELSLLDRATGNVVGESKTVVLPDRAGLFALDLPALSVSDRWYEWYLEIDCSPEDDPDNYTYLDISGFIYQDGTATAETITISDPQQRLDAYQNQGVWYDAFDLLAQDYCEMPANAQNQANLADLLTAGELEALANSPIHCP